ncbi:MAG TPA: hypothetical protein VKY19_23885 [Ktedonosporobacter sp.]|jgi:hypothetical protein|nr:hypothetical protein [Ktedonosporobacter sp.]
MPKKSSTARSGAQRNRPKAQKNIELVRPVIKRQEIEEEEQEAEPPAASVSTATATASVTPAAPVIQKEKTETRGSASERLAARRQAAQKAQQRSAATLVTPEHFSYVRRDLITIAVLAAIMFGVIIVLYFFLGAGI